MGTFAVIALFLVLISVAFTWLCGHLSNQRGHGWMLGLVLGFFLGFIGLIIILVMTPRQVATRRTRRTVRGGGSKAIRGAVGGRGNGSRGRVSRGGRRRAELRTTTRYER